MSRNLRERLDEITSDIEKYPLEMHSEHLRDIARDAPHSILVLETVAPLGRYNCVMHALGLVGKMAEYPYPLLVAKTAFISFLITEGALKQCDGMPGVIVVWSSLGGLKHAGRLVTSDCAESKWGLGILCRHGLEEVPVRYGSVSGFYSPLTSETVLKHLEVWCASGSAS